MIEGEVTPERQGVVRLRVSRPGGPSEEIRAAIDTGFTGFLAMSIVGAFSLGLILTSASKTISATNDLTALGTVVVGNEERVGNYLA